MFVAIGIALFILGIHILLSVFHNFNFLIFGNFLELFSNFLREIFSGRAKFFALVRILSCSSSVLILQSSVDSEELESNSKC